MSPEPSRSEGRVRGGYEREGIVNTAQKMRPAMANDAEWISDRRERMGLQA
jgi:hypothetical protein